ncbi:C-X-C motif chemokine 16, partial [Galemys pyrenaicus]
RRGQRKRKPLRNPLDSTPGSVSGLQTARGGHEMWLLWVPQFRMLLLLLLAWLTLPGYGNEGSRAGSCHCDKRFPSHSPPTGKILQYFQQHLEVYLRCFPAVRFQIHFDNPPYQRSVCGGSKDQWVLNLMSCFDQRECGLAHFGNMDHQKHLHPTNVQVPESTERAPLNISSPVQMYLPPTLQPNLLAGTPSLDEKLTYPNKTINSTVGRRLEVKDEQNQDKVNSAAGTPALLPVLSLLLITFMLTIVLIYVLCKRRQNSSGKVGL